MGNPLKVLSGPTPDETDLELLIAGAVDDPEDVARIEAAARGPLADAAQEIEDLRAYWQSAARPPLFPPAVTSSPATRWWRVGGVLAMAAALLLVVVTGRAMWPQPDAPLLDPDAGGVRTMGQLAVDLVVRRAGTQVSPVPGHFREGDRIGLAFIVPRDGFVQIASVQDNGEVSVLWHSPADTPLRAGERFVLDGSITLDHHEGQEWLVVRVTEATATREEVVEELTAMLPEPAAPTVACCQWVFDLSRAP